MMLHEPQIRILKTVQAAAAKLGMIENLSIVGSLAKCLATGENGRVGDIDVLIDAALCRRYWEFVKLLADGGIVSVWDVADHPNCEWKHCTGKIAHGLSLTIDCSANCRGSKHCNLDIELSDVDLEMIPNSLQWILGPLLPADFRKLGSMEIQNKHRELSDHLKNEARRVGELSQPAFCQQFGLRYAAPKSNVNRE